MAGGATHGAGWLDRFFGSYYAHRPVNATFIGVHDMDHRLPDFSENGAGDALADMAQLLREANAPGFLDEAVSPWEALDRRLARGFLKIQEWEYGSRHFHRGNPSLYAGEAIFGILSLFLSDFAPLGERMEKAAARMAGVHTLLAQGRENVREAPRAWTERAIRECTGALAFLTEGIEALLAGSEAAPADRERLGKAAAAAGAAFQAFREHLSTELLRHPSEHHACGEEAFSLYMKEGHFLQETPGEILAYARAQLEEAESRVAEHPGFRPRDLARLAELHPPVHRYYEAYRDTWNDVRARAEENDLLTWPDFPIRYVPRPRWFRGAAPHLYFLYYRSPAALNRPPVHHYLVTPIEPDMPPERQEELLRANNDSVIKLNHVIHHGSIGHHVQNWHAFRSPSRVGRIAAVDCASRIALFCGGTMAEGWACYATDLMAEAGALTPLERYAELRGRTRMCARAIVDVQLHARNLSLEEAASFYQEHAGMPREAAVGEAVKNSMFPGAAVIYLLGTDAIHGLRRELSARAAREASPFRLRDFHDEFLSYGSVPVALIAEDMLRKRGRGVDPGAHPEGAVGREGPNPSPSSKPGRTRNAE